MAIRIFLAIEALIWLPYGLFCLVNPGYLEGAAGLAAHSATGTAELRAMYGGLQAGIGGLALLGALRPQNSAHALYTVAFLCTGLALARTFGVAVDGGLSGYTNGALAFEFLSAGLAGWFLMRAAAQAGPAASEQDAL